MKKNILSITLITCFAFVIVGLTSCNKEDNTIKNELSNFVEEAEADVQLQTRSGSGSCFELLWPITITLPDGTEAEVEDKDDLKATAKQWKEDNPKVKGRIKVVFPIEVISEGNIITVESGLALKKLRVQCIDRPHIGDKKPCFRLVFPVSIVFPDGEIVAYEFRKGVKLALRKWKIENPGATDRPSLNYPITIKLKDGSTVIVNSKEELMQIKEDCNG